MSAVLPTSTEMVSGTQTNAEQKIDLAALVDFAVENTNKGTTAGTTTAYTLTLDPALSVLESGQRFRLKINAANTSTTPTLAVNGLTAKNLKVYGPTGVKQNPRVGQLALNMLVDIEYDGTDYVAFVSNGGASGPIARAYLSANQSIGFNTWTRVNCDGETFDPDAAFNNTGSTVGSAAPYSFNPGVPGYYRVSGAIRTASATDQTGILIGIYKNGAEAASLSQSSAGELTDGAALSDLIAMNGSSDYLQLYGYVITGTSIVFQGGTTKTFITFEYVRPL